MMMLPVPVLLLLNVVFAFPSVKVTDRVTIVGRESRVEDDIPWENLFSKQEGIQVEQYTGIQYATKKAKFLLPEDAVYSKVGERRVINAKEPGVICPRVGADHIPKILKTLVSGALSYGKGTSEDSLRCLTLDIFVPKSSSNESSNSNSVSKKKKVIMFVHGGGMTGGSRQQGHNRGDQFHREASLSDTILVSVDYSLGPWGFWHFVDSANNDQIHSNAALHEVISALRWVHRYIEAFGGDPNDITLMGQSAGATIVQYVHFMLNSKERAAALGFGDNAPFNKLVLMSGSAFLFRPKTVQEALARQDTVLMNSACANKDDIVACFQQLTDTEISAAADKDPQIWSPVIDGEYILGDAKFHLEKAAFGHGKEWKPTVLLTVTKDDSSIFCISKAKEIDELGVYYWGNLMEESALNELADEYHCDKHGKCQLRASVRLSTDALFVGPALATRKAYVEAGLTVFLHQFNFVFQEISKLELLTEAVGVIGDTISELLTPKGTTSQKHKVSKHTRKIQRLGCFHGSELWLLFNTPISEGIRIMTVSSAEQMREVLNPLYAFLTGVMGKEKLKKLLDEPKGISSAAAKVPVGEVVEFLYVGKGRAVKQQVYQKYTSEEEKSSDEKTTGERKAPVEKTLQKVSTQKVTTQKVYVQPKKPTEEIKDVVLESVTSVTRTLTTTLKNVHNEIGKNGTDEIKKQVGNIFDSIFKW